MLHERVGRDLVSRTAERRCWAVWRDIWRRVSDSDSDGDGTDEPKNRDMPGSDSLKVGGRGCT
jgi:hypothetical protein